MSQLTRHPQQNVEPFNTQTQTELQFFPQESPTVGRNKQLQYSPNNSSPSDSAKRSQRKAAPSPLQTSTTASSPPSSVTPTRSTFQRSAFDSLSAPSPQEQPLSPERSFYRSEDSSVDSIHNQKTRHSPPDGTQRSVSDPVIDSKASEGSPQHRADMGPIAPRTSSIDSAISNISSTNASQKLSQDSSSGSADIANLIQAAGSPEAVIQYLLKEKQSQTAQNAQLWRLVDKQRAMILGLNKDLERALKDKERYRKKLKESLAQLSNPSPVDSNQGLPFDTGSATSESAVAEVPRVEALVSTRLREDGHTEDQPPSPIDVALAPYPITPPADHRMTGGIQTPGLVNMVEAEHKMPSPTRHAFQNYNPDAPLPGFEAGQQSRKAEVAREIPYNASVPPSRSLPSDPPRGPPPKAPPPRTQTEKQQMALPSLAVIEASPNPDENLKTFPTPPPRKAPPAPLNLGKKIDASSHLRQASGTGEESDSDYDDILEVDEIPIFPERGRRKTREDDDREREIAAMKDAELRSHSKKSAKSKSGTTTPKESTFPPPKIPNPLSPRPTIPIAPPADIDSHTSSNAGSLAGILSDSRTSNSSGISGPLSPPLMSPGLPLSPRPMDRGLSSPALPRNPSNHSSTLNSPPMSPRMGGFPGSVPLSPRAPRQAIPLPPNTPMSIASPGLIPVGQPMQLISPKPLVIAKKTSYSPPSTSPQDEMPPPNYQAQSPLADGIFKGYVTEEYPELLLPPNALPSIDVRVASSRLKPSRVSLMFPKNMEDYDPVFTLAIFSRADGRELWRVEKDTASLSQLDQVLKKSASFTAKTPDKSLFSGHAPAKVDARRAALDKYLDEILNTQMDTAAALEICRYISTNAMEPNAEEMTPNGESTTESPLKTGPGGRPLKNGYLTKRGKNFGGWKARFFVLDGPIFNYYESPGGPHLGKIKLQNSQIGKQQQSDNQSPSRGDIDDVDNQYRHAFLILEPKRKDSSSLVRHVLCAESDRERDQWVEALLQYVDYKDSEDEEEETPPHREHVRNDSDGSSASHHVNGMNAKKKMYAQARSPLLELNTDLRGISYETTKQGSLPHGVRPQNGTPSPPTNGYERDPMSQISQSQSLKSISAPRNAQPIQDSGSWGNKQALLNPLAVEDKKQRKRSFFGFGPKPRPSTDSQEASANDSSTNLTQMAYEQHGPIRPQFGAPLGEAVRYNHPADVNIELPSVVYRCIEYLDAKNAVGEEGIFRLSGSNVVIKQLKERFNTEGDVNLITDDQYYDIHAVASLLKLYFRELPTTILTRELHLEFVAVTELNGLGEKTSALNGLVHRLPTVNNNILRYLAGFLINIINHADTNKMTVRNVGIVFSPTLNIPAPVFALFLQQYDAIFGQEPDRHDQRPVQVTVAAPPLSPDDLRSPRQSHFQNLPTPSYDQQSFPQHHPQQRAPPNFPAPKYAQGSRAGYDTGFTPLKPSYETQLQGTPTMAGPEYGRMTPTLGGPAYDQFNGGNGAYRQFESQSQSQQTKSKRRESSMFGMGMGMGMVPRKSSNLKLRENNSGFVEQESFFD